jgi:dTDP-4-dehydrorhamnose reductase
MHILVTGSNSQLGRSINYLSRNVDHIHSFVFASKGDLNLSNITEIEGFIKTGNFDLIVNCAAYTQVDRAELDQKQVNLINHLAVKKIAEVAQENNIKLIHISTDFVFDGKKNQPYDESDNTIPINIYGKTKLAGEEAILSVMKFNAIILRTSWMYSEYGNNFVDTILRLSKNNKTLNIVSDQIGNPTYALDLSQVILSILMNKKYEAFDMASKIYHYSNEGDCSWYDFAKEIVNISGHGCLLKPILLKDYPSEANRPQYVSMSKTKIIEDFGIKTFFWKDSLKKCLKNLSF